MTPSNGKTRQRWIRSIRTRSICSRIVRKLATSLVLTSLTVRYVVKNYCWLSFLMPTNTNSKPTTQEYTYYTRSWKWVSLLATKIEEFRTRAPAALVKVATLELSAEDLLDDEVCWLIESCTGVENIGFWVRIFYPKKNPSKLNFF